jgi:hypothetical protein
MSMSRSAQPPMIVYEIMEGGSLEDIFRSQTKKKGFWRPSRSQVKPASPESLQLQPYSPFWLCRSSHVEQLLSKTLKS